MPDVTLEISDGTTARAHEVVPEGATGAPGLVLFQEAFGVNAHIRDVAGRFAGQGYVVVAPEMFHRTADPGFEAAYGDFDDVRPHVNALTPEGIAADAEAAYLHLAHHPSVDPERIVAIGFCMGGRCAWLANATQPLRAAVSYYGGGIAPALVDRARLLNAPHLFFWGGRDRHITAEHRNAITGALDAADRPYVNVVMSAADHGFFCDARPAYHPDSAAESWALTLEFFRRNLKQQG